MGLFGSVVFFRFPRRIVKLVVFIAFPATIIGGDGWNDNINEERYYTPRQ